jgi:hypothetical protein
MLIDIVDEVCGEVEKLNRTIHDKGKYRDLKYEIYGEFLFDRTARPPSLSYKGRIGYSYENGAGKLLHTPTRDGAELRKRIRTRSEEIIQDHSNGERTYKFDYDTNYDGVTITSSTPNDDELKSDLEKIRKFCGEPYEEKYKANSKPETSK